MNVFVKYMCLEILVWVYLGCWNVTVPLVIIKQGSLAELATYETVLALAAVISMIGLASRVEMMRRTTALKLACTVVVVSGLLRYLCVSKFYSFAFLIIIDVLAVSAFGVIQPLFGVYPAEVVAKDRVEYAFRVRRIAMTISRVAGPLVAGVVIAMYSTGASLLFSAILGMVALGISIALPKSTSPKVSSRKNMTQRIQDMSLGIKLKFSLPPERFLTLSGFLLGLVTAATLPLLVPSIVHAYGLGEEQVGLLGSTFAAGAVTGLVVLSPLIAGRNKQQKKFASLWALLTFALVASAYSTTIWQLLPSLFVVGAASACLSLIGLDKRTLAVPPAVRIRLTAATLVVGQLANAMSYLIVGATLSRFDFHGLVVMYVVVFFIALICIGLSTVVWRFLEDSGDSELYYRNNHPTVMRDMTG